MNGSRIKSATVLTDSVTGDVLVMADLTPARVRALVKAYQLAGVFVAVA